ncbi:MAG TPA: tetratricopeptide repeat protein [Kofleriaceae bacterium]|nr:tetratricopeptide repeat protein [Kofleriaceae bacterium]
MSDPDRRPTAQEIEELIDLVRRDPGSPAFIDLGEAYLSLGRPRDAAQVGTMGLEASPDNLEGRVMLARAYAAMHQWKEAQGELLRVVKVDRSNRQGFALLGEVLLRRTDYERAVPVLQHAQNLDPTSPAILSMLRRARAGQALDPPPPIPQPVPPRGETGNPHDIQGSRGGAGAPPRPMPAPGMPAPGQGPRAMPTMAIQPPRADPGMPTLAEAPPPGYGAPAQMMSPAAPPQRPSQKAAPPPMSVEGVRPRIVSGHKQQNAAAASLRQSAAVGETYLNELLTGGLLDVAGVRVPDAEFDLRPDRRWGRSTRRAFIFLFVVLVLGIGGGGTWYWWSEKQKAEAVARLQKDAKKAIGHGEFGFYDTSNPDSHGLEAAIGKLNEALQKDKSNLLTFAYVVEVTGLEALLYGTEFDRVDRAIKAISKDIAPGDPGERELVIGKAAVELARLYTLDPQAGSAARDEVQKLLDGYLAKHDTDKWAKWLKGRALLAAGERKAAAAQFKVAAEGEDGLALAMIDRADLHVDDGQLDDGLALYKKASEKSKDHPLIVLGRSIARAESSFEEDQVIPELNEKFNLSKIPPRSAAYRFLALALANLASDDYAKAIDALKKAETSTAKPPGDPRFWARVAWVHLLLGDLASGAQARVKVVWFNKKPEADPTVQLVDAGLLLASGLPAKALELAEKIEGPRPRMLRVYADLDLGKYKDALNEAEALIKAAPQNVEAAILAAQARMMAAANERERGERADALEKLARKTNGKLGRHALGVAWLAAGNIANAKTALEAAINDVSDTSPNPLAYRTLTALADVALAEKDLATAGKYLDWALDPDASHRPELVLSNKVSIKALDENKKRTPYADFLKANSGFFPTRAMQAKVVLRNQEPDRALDLLAPILKERGNGAVTPTVNLVLAEALITRKKSSAVDKQQAKDILIELRNASSAPVSELSRIAALIDPKLPKELDLPEPEDPNAPKGGAKKPPPRRGGR